METTSLESFEYMTVTLVSAIIQKHTIFLFPILRIGLQGVKQWPGSHFSLPIITLIHGSRSICRTWENTVKLKDLALTPPMRTPKSRLTAAWTSVKKNGTYQKRYATSKGKEETTRLEEDHTHNIIKSNIPQVGYPQTEEQLCHRSSPMGLRVLSPIAGPPAKVSWHWEEKLLEHLALKATGI